MSEGTAETGAAPPGRRRLLAFLPLALFAGLALIFLFRLFAGDPAKLPSTLIGRPAPAFALPAIEGVMQAGSPLPGFSTADLGKGRVALVNVFASWCAPCREEHPFLMELAKDGRFAIFGINQKDRPENARRFLASLGNPYSAAGADADGRASIEWGVYGVPETFVVDAAGRIVFKHVGPLDAGVVQAKLLPALEKALTK